MTKMKSCPLAVWMPLLILAASLCQSAVAKADLPYPAVGKISVSNLSRGGLPVGNVGTGILLNHEGLFLTNFHNIIGCFRAENQNPRKNPNFMMGRVCRAKSTIEFVNAGFAMKVKEFKVVNLGSIGIDQNQQLYRDWALLKISHPRLKEVPLPKIAEQNENIGEIRILGFPAQPVGQVVQTGKELRMTAGRLLDYRRTMNNWVKIYSELALNISQFQDLLLTVKRNFFTDNESLFHNAPVFPGYSGGPIFNEREEMIGITWGSLTLWNEEYGPLPQEKLGLDFRRPEKLSNQMATGLRNSAFMKHL